MYEATNTIQARTFMPKVKLNAEMKRSEKKEKQHHNFKDAIETVFQDRSISNKKEQQVKNRSKNVKTESTNSSGISDNDGEDLRLQEEADLEYQQLAMGMAISNETVKESQLELANQNLVDELSGNMKPNDSMKLEPFLKTMPLNSKIQGEELQATTIMTSKGMDVSVYGNKMMHFETLKNQDGMQKTKGAMALPLSKQAEQSMVNPSTSVKLNDSTEKLQGQNTAEKILQTEKNGLEKEATVSTANNMSSIKQESFDFSKVNIKVSDGSVNANSQTMGQDIADKILYQASEGKTEFELQMNPKSLGAIRVKLVFESGRVLVILNCSNPKTQELLLGNAENIRSIIEQQTGSATMVTVKEDVYQEQQNFDGRGQNDRQEEQRQQQQNKNDTVDAAVFLQQLKLGLVGKEDDNYEFN